MQWFAKQQQPGSGRTAISNVITWGDTLPPYHLAMEILDLIAVVLWGLPVCFSWWATDSIRYIARGSLEILACEWAYLAKLDLHALSEGEDGGADLILGEIQL